MTSQLYCILESKIGGTFRQQNLLRRLNKIKEMYAWCNLCRTTLHAQTISRLDDNTFPLWTRHLTSPEIQLNKVYTFDRHTWITLGQRCLIVVEVINYWGDKLLTKAMRFCNRFYLTKTNQKWCGCREWLLVSTILHENSSTKISFLQHQKIIIIIPDKVDMIQTLYYDPQWKE